MALEATIKSKSNARVKLLRASFGGAGAKAGDLVGIEGEHLLGEALRSGVGVETVFVREGSEGVLERVSLRGLRGRDVSMLSREVFASAVDTASPQGVAALVKIPEVGVVDFSVPGVSLVLESLQDPGNLGTLLRTAEAFGVKQVFMTPDTVSAWNPKAMRASAGSVFRVPVYREGLQAIVERLAMAQVRLFAAVAHGEGVLPAPEALLQAPCAIMVGNEGAGLSPAALQAAQVRVRIPCAVESLNASVAAAILLYQASVQSAFARG